MEGSNTGPQMEEPPIPTETYPPPKPWEPKDTSKVPPKLEEKCPVWERNSPEVSPPKIEEDPEALPSDPLLTPLPPPPVDTTVLEAQEPTMDLLIHPAPGAPSKSEEGNVTVLPVAVVSPDTPPYPHQVRRHTTEGSTLPGTTILSVCVLVTLISVVVLVTVGVGFGLNATHTSRQGRLETLQEPTMTTQEPPSLPLNLTTPLDQRARRAPTTPVPKEAIPYESQNIRYLTGSAAECYQNITLWWKNQIRGIESPRVECSNLAQQTYYHYYHKAYYLAKEAQGKKAVQCALTWKRWVYLHEWRSYQEYEEPPACAETTRIGKLFPNEPLEKVQVPSRRSTTGTRGGTHALPSAGGTPLGSPLDIPPWDI